jgi:Ca2+-binding RTX toxin-like protein
MKRLFKNLFETKTDRKPFRPALEALDERRLPSTVPPIVITLPPSQVTASLSHGVLRVDGTLHDDHITVRQANGHIEVAGQSFLASQVSRIEIDGSFGNDLIDLGNQSLHAATIIVHGGAGNDAIYGSAGNDRLYGDSGDDLIIGGSGNDFLNGGAGRDALFGGAGNDVLLGDLYDQVLAGQAGTDQIAFYREDPAPLLAGYTDTVKNTLNGYLHGKSFSESLSGETVKVDNMRVADVRIVDGVTTIEMTADIHYKKTRGLIQFSESGSIRFTVQPQVSATLVEGHVNYATIALANPQVLNVSLHNVPSWLSNSGQVRDFLQSKMQGYSVNFTSQLALLMQIHHGDPQIQV